MIHGNSVASYYEMDIDGRSAEVLSLFLQVPGPMTDRDCMELLGSKDPNTVRPSITRLLADEKLVERGSIIDRVTGRRVRICSPATR